MDKLRSGEMSSYFTKKPVIITYVLLALAFILVIVLFANIYAQHFTPDKKEMASKDDIVRANNTVQSIAKKLKEIEGSTKKIGTCPKDWKEFDRTCYFFSTTKSNWDRARSMCVQKTANLVVINNENEQRFISGMTGSTPYWIGLSDKEEKGKWTWVDGTDYATSYKSWSPSEPRSSGGEEDCAQTNNQGTWNGKSCHDNTSFAICEKKL